MNNKYIIFITIALLAGTVSYIALDNLFITLGIFAMYLIAGIALFVPLLNRHEKKTKRFHECYHFINNFVISLSIKKSIKGALETTVNSMPSEFIEMYESLDDISDREKLNYLSTYFNFNVYRIFLQIVDLWEEDGGDILRMSKYLIGEIRNNEEYISKADSMSSHKYVEIGVLWLFCMMIVVILRFSLSDFYSNIKKQLIYIISIAALFLFVLLTIYLLIHKATKLKIKEYQHEEKNV